MGLVVGRYVGSFSFVYMCFSLRVFVIFASYLNGSMRLAGRPIKIE